MLTLLFVTLNAEPEYFIGCIAFLQTIRKIILKIDFYLN